MSEEDKTNPTSRRGLLKAGAALILGVGAIVQPFGGVTGSMAEEAEKKETKKKTKAKAKGKGKKKAKKKDDDKKEDDDDKKKD
jgi:hypothetical protein